MQGLHLNVQHQWFHAWPGIDVDVPAVSLWPLNASLESVKTNVRLQRMNNYKLANTRWSAHAESSVPTSPRRMAHDSDHQI